MKKNIVIVALVIFIGLLMLYSFQQKSYADVKVKEIEMELITCQENAEKQTELAKQAIEEAEMQRAMAIVAEQEAMRQKNIAESKNR